MSKLSDFIDENVTHSSERRYAREKADRQIADVKALLSRLEASSGDA